MQAKALASYSFFPSFNSQFNYCAIVWMFCSRKSKLRLENIHKRTLRVVYNEYEKNYKDLLAEHQFVIFKPLTYCFKETIGFDVKALFASRP